MKILNLYKYILLVICGLQSVTLAAQGFDDDRAINNVLTMRVKMLDEFFQRFNGKYTVHAFQQENLDSVLLEKMATVMKDREMMIQFLVNQREIGRKSGCKGIRETGCEGFHLVVFL